MKEKKEEERSEGACQMAVSFQLIVDCVEPKYVAEGEK